MSHLGIIYAYQFRYIRDHTPTHLTNLLGTVRLSCYLLYLLLLLLLLLLLFCTRLTAASFPGLYHWEQLTNWSDLGTSLWQAVVGLAALVVLYFWVFTTLPPLLW
jgi:hypothetical protein